MKQYKFKVISLALIMAIIVQVFMPMKKVEASGVKSKSVTVTLDAENPYHSFRIKMSKKTYAMAEIKILQVTGKAKKQSNGRITFGGYTSFQDGVGSYFYSLKPKSFTKGNILQSEDGVYRNGGVTFSLPQGLKKLKIRITFKTKDNSKSLKMVKETDVKDYYMYDEEA